MTQAEAGLDRNKRWHIIQPKSNSCEMGHRLRNWDGVYESLTAEGLTDVRRALGNRTHEVNEDICQNCEW